MFSLNFMPHGVDTANLWNQNIMNLLRRLAFDLLLTQRKFKMVSIIIDCIANNKISFYEFSFEKLYLKQDKFSCLFSTFCVMILKSERCVFYID